MNNGNKSRLPLYAFVGFTFLMFAYPAEAHLNSTGMGPFYDGLVHFLMSPEDIVPSAGACLACWPARSQSWTSSVVCSSHGMATRRLWRSQRVARQRRTHSSLLRGFSCWAV